MKEIHIKINHFFQEIQISHLILWVTINKDGSVSVVCGMGIMVKFK